MRTSSCRKGDDNQIAKGRDGLEDGEEGLVVAEDAADGELEEPGANINASCLEELGLGNNSSLGSARQNTQIDINAGLKSVQVMATHVYHVDGRVQNSHGQHSPPTTPRKCLPGLLELGNDLNLTVSECLQRSYMTTRTYIVYLMKPAVRVRDIYDGLGIPVR